MNEEDNLSEEGLEDPYEKELREAKEEENQRNQKDYEENKYRNRELQRRQEERKRQQLDIPGLFEARSGFRTTAALGTEIFLNTLVDPFMEPATQVAAGTLFNLIAQRIRGGELSKGELAAAGLASLIPGGAQGRAVTQFAKGVGKGGLAGGIESIGMAGIDRGELPTLTEFGTSVGIGAAFGGALSTPQGAKAIGEIRKKVNDASYDIIGALTRAGISSDSLIAQGGSPMIPPPKKGSGDPEGLRSLKYQQGDILANTPEKNVKLLKDLELTDDESVFLLSNYYKEGSVTSTTITRDQAAAIESLYTTVEEFDKTKDLALPYFLKGMKGIKRNKTPQLDHIAQLKAALPFFNNAKVSQFPEITKIILEEGVFGLGHQRGNFKYLEFDVHTVKSNYFEDIVGNNGEKFFKNKDISTPEKLRAAAKEFAAIINNSNNVVADAIEQYKFMNKIDISESELDEFVNILSQQPIRRKYSIKQVKDIFKQMEEDGFMQTSKQSQKVETEQIKAEQKELSRQERLRKQLDKDTVSVEARQKQMESFLNENLDTFNVNPYPLGMKDESLREAAEDTYRLFKENQLAIEGNIQRSLFESEEREKFIKVMMKSILNRVRRDLRKNKKK